MTDNAYKAVRWEDGSWNPDDYEWVGNYKAAIPVVSTIELSDGEASAYAARALKLFPHCRGVYVMGVDDGDVELHYVIDGQGFERIRRITGYLVGTLDRFNDAKRAEESERVKHGVGGAR